jgi:hypothetical protein
LNIPQNKVAFYDFYIKNVKLNYDGVEKITNFAAQYKEELINELFFNAYFVDIGGLEGYYVILSMMQKKQNIKMMMEVFEIKKKADFI